MILHRPVYIISGFLGSGKTTFLNRILKENHGMRFAVIVNELGEVGLDSALMATTEDFVKMDNGCLCCALNAELMEKLEKLAPRDDFDAVLVETTGIADPLTVAWTFFRPTYKDAFRFGGIITLADALHFDTTHQEHLEVALQIDRADYLLVTKAELVDPIKANAFFDLLREINPRAKILDRRDARIFDLIFDISKNDLGLPSVATPTDHDPLQYDSIAIPLQDIEVSLSVLEDFFENLPMSIFRAKAGFQDSLSRNWYVMHAVCGRVEFFSAEKEIPDPVAIFIGKNITKEKLKKDFFEKFKQVN